MITTPTKTARHDAEDHACCAATEEAVVTTGDRLHLRERLVGLEGVAAAQ
jgi:hypothetical protein